jgi:WD40 repeat protein
VALIEPGDRATYRRLFFPGLRIAAVALHPDGRHLVAAGSGLAGWDLVAGRELPVVSEPEIASVFFDPAGGHLVTAGAAGIQRRSLGDAGTPPSQVRFGAPELLQPPGRSAFEAVLSGDGQTLVVVDNRSRAVAVTWGTRELRPWLTGPINMKYPAVSPDGRWAATGSQYGNEVRVWDTRTGGTVHHIPHATGAATRVAFSADGRWLFVGVLGEYRLLEVGSWREHWRAPADSAGDVHAPGGLMAVAPDSAVAAVRHSRSVIRLLDVASGRELADLTAPDLGLLSSLSFGPGGRLLAAATEDGTVHLWDLHLVRERLAALGLDWGPPDGAGH